MMTVTLAREFEEHGDNIAVVAINPGYVATRLTNYRSNMQLYVLLAALKVKPNAVLCYIMEKGR